MNINTNISIIKKIENIQKIVVVDQEAVQERKNIKNITVKKKEKEVIHQKKNIEKNLIILKIMIINIKNKEMIVIDQKIKKMKKLLKENRKKKKNVSLVY